MEQPVRFRVLVGQDIKKLTLHFGIPSSVNDLVATIKDDLSITSEISLQYKDEDFDDFFTLTSTSELKDKDTLRVVYASPLITLTVVPQESTPDASNVSSQRRSSPKKAEVNFLPTHLPGETDETLETVRLNLIAASKKRDNVKSINDMMARTYSLRRKEVVGESPDLADFKERWPALFEPFQISEEFRRCTTVHLESTFVSQLDRYTPKLLELFLTKGGAVGQRIKNLLVELIQDPCICVVKKRELTLRCLCEFMGESAEELISDYYGTAESSVHEELKMHSMKIYACHEPDAVGIIIEGIPVLTHLDNVTRACCLLLGVTYALNLKYPSKLTYTFEVF